jgi:hypothetical protein
VEIQKKLQEELQTLSVMNKKLKKKYETVMGIEVNLRMELERVKIANNINKYSKSEMKDCEETRKSLSPGTRSFRRKRKQLRPTHQWN